MKLPRRKFLHLAAGAAALPVVSRIESARAQDYPAKPVRIITHSAPGGSPDALLRIVGDRLSQMWGRQIVVLNHPGAGGAVAARTAAQAAPDGYTLYMPASSAFVTLSGLQANLPLEVPRDYAPVGFVALQPFFLSVVSSLAAKSIPEFIALAKEQPGELSYAATGRGTLSHLTGEALQQRAGIKLLMVPYLGGTPQALNDVISGRVPMVNRRLSAVVGRAAGWSHQGARRRLDQTAVRLSRPAYRRGDISRLQSRRLARSGRPGRHARRDCAQAERRLARGSP